MTEWDKAYLELNKPEPDKEPEDSLLLTYGYLAGCVIAVVFWVWFLMWFVK